MLQPIARAATRIALTVALGATSLAGSTFVSAPAAQAATGIHLLCIGTNHASFSPD